MSDLDQLTTLAGRMLSMEIDMRGAVGARDHEVLVDWVRRGAVVRTALHEMNRLIEGNDELPEHLYDLCRAASTGLAGVFAVVVMATSTTLVAEAITE